VTFSQKNKLLKSAVTVTAAFPATGAPETTGEVEFADVEMDSVVELLVTLAATVVSIGSTIGSVMITGVTGVGSVIGTGIVASGSVFLEGAPQNLGTMSYSKSSALKQVNS